MCSSVGSSSALIDVIGQVGMFSPQSLQLPYRLKCTKGAGPPCGEPPCSTTRYGWRWARGVVRETRPTRRDDLTNRLQASPDDQQGGGVEDRAVGAGDDADEEGEREALQRRPAGDQDRGQHEHDGEARDDR